MVMQLSKIHIIEIIYPGEYLHSFLNYTLTSYQCIINYKKLYHNLFLIQKESEISFFRYHFLQKAKAML